MLKKLSKRSIENIKIFLNDDQFGYMSVSKHDMKILFEMYEKAMIKMMEYENEIELLKEKKQ